MMPGARLVILAAWIAMLGLHASRHLGARGAPLAPALAAHAGQRLSYAVLADRAGGQRLAGTCEWRCERGAGGLRAITHASLTDATFIPGFSRLAAALGAEAGEARALELDEVETLDAEGRLARVELAARAFGADATASAALAADGTELRWAMPGVSEGSSRHPAPRLGEATAMALLGAMPAGLRPGQRFAIATLGADPASFAPQARRAAYRVGTEVEEATAVGQRLLLPVTADDGAAGGASVWCDQAGTVYRARIDALGVTLELRGASGGPP